MTNNQTLIDENCRVYVAIETLDAKYAELQLQLSETLDNLAWAEAEIRNLRAWRDVAQRLTTH